MDSSQNIKQNTSLSTTEPALFRKQEQSTETIETVLPKPITIEPETLKQTGKMLFSLWLKIAATLLIARLCVLIWPVIVLLLLSLMLVATFNPMVRRLQNRLTRGWAITTVVFSVLLTCTGLLALVIPLIFRQARNVMVNLPNYLNQIEASLRKVGIPLRLRTNFDLSERAASLGPETWEILKTVFSGVTGILTVAALTTYLLIDGQRVATSVLSILPRHFRLPIRQMCGEIGQQVGEYMRGQLITSGVAGVFSYILLMVLGVPEALALAVLMAVTDAIPIVGAFIGTVPAVMLALTKDTTTGILVLVGYIIYQQIESHVLVPRIYGKTMKMTASVIIISLLIGATLMGVLGALLALPAAAAIPVIFRYFQEMRQREEEVQAEQASNGEKALASSKLP